MPRKRSQSDVSVAKNNLSAYLAARDHGHVKWLENADKYDRFYVGDQWDPADRAKVEGSGRPVMTVNLVLSAINAVLAEHSTQRADIQFKPKRGEATQETASVLSKLVMQIQDDTKYQHHEAQVFSDGVILDRGYFDVRMQFKTNIMSGDVDLMAEDPRDILLDPGAKHYDPRTWREVIKTRFMTLGEIEENYGQKIRKQVEVSINVGDESNYDLVRYKETTFGDADGYFANAYVERNISRVRVIERQYYRTVKIFQLVTEVGDTRDLPPGTTKRKAQKLAELTGTTMNEIRKRKVRWCVSTGDVVIRDEWSPYRTFTIIPFFPFFRRGKPFGMVANLISPQEIVNKIESQELHVINTTANSGWVVEDGSLSNMTTQDLEERGAETGLVLAYRRNRQPPKKIEPNRIPSGLDKMAAKSVENLRAISGVQSLLGLDSDRAAGVTIEKRESRGLAQIQPIFKNLEFTRRLVADKLLELIQDFYTEERIVRATNWTAPGAPIEEEVINQMTPEGEIINNVTLGEYDVTVSSAPSRDTYEDSQFAQAIMLRREGINLPDYHVINTSNLDNKREIADEVRNMMGMGEKTPEQMELENMQMQMEIQAAQLDLAEKEMKVGKLESEMMLNQAKAMSLQGEAQMAAETKGIEMRQEVEKLKVDLTKARENLNNKIQLAEKHIAANREKLMYSTLAKRATEELKLRMQQQKPTPAGNQPEE